MTAVALAIVATSNNVGDKLLRGVHVSTEVVANEVAWVVNHRVCHEALLRNCIPHEVEELNLSSATEKNLRLTLCPVLVGALNHVTDVGDRLEVACCRLRDNTILINSNTYKNILSIGAQTIDEDVVAVGEWVRFGVVYI